MVSVGDDEEWAALCRAIGRPDLATDSRFATNPGRATHHDEIDQYIARWTGTLGKFDVMEHLQGAGVPAGAVFDSRDTNLDKHHWARDFLEKVEYPEDRRMGKRVLMGRPWRLSKTPLSVRGTAPALGQHNREMLQGILGYSEARCDDQEKAGIIADRPTDFQPPRAMSMDELVKQGRLAYHDPHFREKLGI